MTLDAVFQALRERDAVLVAGARMAPLLILTGRALADLTAELGSDDAAYRHLASVSENIGKPVGVNFERGDGSSRTRFPAPKGWTRERLAGWVAGRREEIERAFGEATPVDMEGL